MKNSETRVKIIYYIQITPLVEKKKNFSNEENSIYLCHNSLDFLEKLLE